MERNNGNEKYKTVKEQYRNGAVCVSYGSTHFVSVNPVPTIDKCRFSIVKLGTSGKDHLDFYLDIQDMRQLCEEFIGDASAAIRKIQADMKNQFPSAYSYITGQNGSLILNIGAGEKGCRIQIRDKTKNVQKMTVVPFKDLKEMAFGFYLVMGLIPVMKNSYYGKLYDAFWNGSEERDKYYDSSSESGNDTQQASQGSQMTSQQSRYQQDGRSLQPVNQQSRYQQDGRSSQPVNQQSRYQQANQSSHLTNQRARSQQDNHSRYQQGNQQRQPYNGFSGPSGYR
ncbi:MULTISPECIES: hypothetical protein [Clostridia]|uniref:hypothetical protein n=1 Tax=Clostridia TaxID=186801 RepID=UPI000E5440D0|nr:MULTISPECIES: hypothetical protein [Clostridia]RHV71057.1 hypothetical protein DXB15_03865 [Roseburia sp. OM02-15]